MPLEIRPLRPTDSLSWNRTRALAYYGPTHDLLHNGPVSEASIRGLAKDREREIGIPNVWHWKIVDTDLAPSDDDPKDNGGRTIAIAVWKLMNIAHDDVQHTPEKGKKEDSVRTPKARAPAEHASIPAETEPSTNNGLGPRYSSFLPPELRLDALMSLFDPLDAARDEIMGSEKPYFMLNSLATHPEHQGRGAAKLLLDWGMQKADKEGLVTYLDATQRARPIYAKRGFELKKVVEWDRKVWGGEGVDVHYCMVRTPRSGPK
ncbi:GNAT family protein (acetyltransferase) [Stagonosporopsis vannaccii]|nr:GNAT family protein (acetyltransferase) [Stagonosporopsis vannaccii]